MVVIEPIDWEARLKAAVEKTLRDRDAKRAERAMFAERRNYGLVQRHNTKLARIRRAEQEMTMTEMERHANTARYVDRLRASDGPEVTFVGIVRGLTDPRVSHLGDIRGPIADLMDAYDIAVLGETR